MLKAAIALSLGLASVPTAASAVDWAVKGELGEAVELNDNQFLKSMLAGGSLGSYSTVSTNVEGSTPTSKFDFDSNATYKKYWGPGIDGLQSEYINYGFKAHYEEIGKTKSDLSYIDASYSQQSAALAVFNAFGLSSNVTGFLNQATLRGGLERALTAQDTASFWVRSIYTNYDPSNSLIPFTDTLAVGTWKHQLNPVTTVIGSSEVEYLSYGNQFNTSVLIVRNLAGVDIKITPLLSVVGAAGYAFVRTDNGFGAPFVPGTPGTAASSSVSDFVANILLTYQLMKTTKVFVDASRTIGPTIIGSIMTRNNFRTGIDHDINSLSSLSVYADFSRLIDPLTTDFFTATVQYSTRLTRTWTAKVAYRYIHRFTTTGNALFDPVLGTATGLGLGPANSNGILFVLSKSFVLLPPGT